MISQIKFKIAPRRRGCHLITREILNNLPSPLPKVGLLNIFVQHTSCALTINENADPDVRHDMEMILHDFFFDYDSHEAGYAKARFEDCILLFSSEEEKANFKEYAISKWSDRQNYLEEVRLPYT